jgi:hypothetical protein
VTILPVASKDLPGPFARQVRADGGDPGTGDSDIEERVDFTTRIDDAAAGDQSSKLGSV